MKKSNKLTAAVTASAVMAAMVVPAASAASVSFNDIDSSFAKDAIVKLADLGILNGKGEGKFDPTGNVTRAEFAKILTLALKLDVSSAPASATFADVATDAWSYKYVEAASKAKLINGVGNGQFGPNAMLTREDMAVLFVRALGANVTGKAANLTFADKDSISDYAKDAVAYAVDLGLINGKGDNKFDAKGNASREAIAKVANLFLDVVAKGDLKVEGKTNVGVGEKVQFKATGANTVIWSVSGNGVIDQAGNFVANASGEATVTATAANGKTATLKVNVYAAAAAVKFGEVKDLVANNTSTEEITLNVVDAKGNVVENFNGEIKSLTRSNNSIAFLDANGNEITAGGGDAYGTLKVTNGVAKFKILSKVAVAGVTTDITADKLFSTAANSLVNGFEAVTTTVTAAEQVATAVKVNAPTVVAANDANKAVVTIDVVDQDGQKMVVGTYGLKVNVTGPAIFDATSNTAEQTLAFTGISVPADVRSLKGKTGNITVTATADGLTAGTATIKAAVAADANKLSVGLKTSTDTDTFAQGTTRDYSVSAVDENGTPVALTLGTDKKVYIYDANGKVTDKVAVFGAKADSDGGFPLTATDFTVEAAAPVAPATTNAAAGTYKIVVKDAVQSGTDALKDSEATNFTITPATADTLAISAATDYVAVSKPENTYTVQVTDANGNPVKQADLDVNFTATSANKTVKAAFNGKTMKTDTALGDVSTTVKTDADGKATVSFASQGYDGVKWTVQATAAAPFGTSSSKDLNIVYAPTAQLKLAIAGDSGSATKITAGTPFAFTLSQLDAYGATINGEDDTVQVKFSNPDAADLVAAKAAAPAGVTVDTVAGTITGKYNLLTAAPSFLNTLVAKKAGAVTVTVTDLSVTTAKSASATIRVWAETTAHHFGLFDASGNALDVNNLTVEANKEVALTLKPVDTQGNPVVAAGDLTAVVADTASATKGSFRLVSNGAPVAPNATGDTEIAFTNGAISKTVYFVATDAGTHTFAVTIK